MNPQEQVNKLGSSRPFQAAQRALTTWFSRNKPRWAENKTWRELDDQQAVQAGKGFLKSFWYRKCKNEELKKNIATYCHLLISTGKVPKPGKHVVLTSQQQQQAEQARQQNQSAQEKTVSSIALQVTMYPRHSEWNDKFGRGQYPNVNAAAKQVLQDPEYSDIKEQINIWLEEQQRHCPYLDYAPTAELCPESWKKGSVKLHVHVQMSQKNQGVLTMPAVMYFQSKELHIKPKELYVFSR